MREIVGVLGCLTMQNVTFATSRIITGIVHNLACYNMDRVDKFRLAKGEGQMYSLSLADLLLTPPWAP